MKPLSTRQKLLSTREMLLSTREMLLVASPKLRPTREKLRPTPALVIAIGIALVLTTQVHAQDGAAAATSGPAAAGDGGADVSTAHGAAHTSSATTTRSGAAPTHAEDTSAAPVIDPVTAPAPTRSSSAPEEEEEDDGDGRDYDILWIELQGGVSYANLIQFQNQNFADVAGGASIFNEVYGTGPAVGVGVGFRVWWLAIGARANVAVYETFQIGTVGGEATLRLPVPVVEPWVRVGFAYGWQGDAQYQSGASTYSTTTYGWVFQSGLGLDIYLTNWFTLGAGVGLDILNMTRQRDPSATCMGATDVCPSRNGDALGFQLKGLATVGFRF